MIRFLGIGFSLVLFSGGIGFVLLRNSSGDGTRAPTDAVSVEISESGYTPSELRIMKGETVLFVNHSSNDAWPASDIHPTHGIYPEFDSREPLAPGDQWDFTFERIGTWRFHDHLAPQIRGQIAVE